MYLEYFGLKEKPFQITPDPRFLFMSKRHRDGFAHLLYGTDEAGGFVLLTGEVGTGKTTLCRSVLESASTDLYVALILNPRQSPKELVASIMDELGIDREGLEYSLKTLIDHLNQYLLDAYRNGKRVIVVIDEAQSLETEVLEQVRLLTNLEVASQKLLQIILIGQPELQTMLKRPELRQLAQRITARFHLTPLSREETADYVRHRLKVAGVNREIFTSAALNELYKLSSGIPRLINVICERALIGAYGLNQPVVKKTLMARSSDEVFGKHVSRQRSFADWVGIAAMTAGVVAVVLAVWTIFQSGKAPVTEVAQTQNTITTAETMPAVKSKRVVDALVSPVVEDSNASIRDTIAAAPSFHALLNAPVANGGTEPAFSALFALWGENFENLSGRTACERAATVGLRCIFKRDGWESLRRLDRPAVIELKSESGVDKHVVFQGFKDDYALLKFSNAEVKATLEELLPVWSGQFIVLWRPPFEEIDTFFQGYKGPNVLWLRHQLDRIEGKPPAKYTQGNLEFDGSLTQRVKDVQARLSLVADGIVGPETYIAIANSDANENVPRLLNPDNSKDN